MKPLTELRTLLTSLRDRWRSHRRFRDVLDVEVAADVTTDLEAEYRAISSAAYSNEQAELTLAQEIRDMVADGFIDRTELRQLRLAPKTLNRCAERSHDIAEATS